MLPHNLYFSSLLDIKHPLNCVSLAKSRKVKENKTKKERKKHHISDSDFIH